MTVGFQNVGYTNYPQTNVLNQAQTKVANTSIQDSYTPAKTKSNKAAVAVGLTTAAGIALTAFAATKGKKITGQDKLLANLKAGFSQIKDDAVKYAKTMWDKIKNLGSTTASETIKPNNVEMGLSVITNGATQAADDVAQNTSKTIKGIVDTYFDEAGNKISITKDGCKVTEFANGFNIVNPDMNINSTYNYQNKIDQIIDTVVGKGKNIFQTIKSKVAEFTTK